MSGYKMSQACFRKHPNPGALLGNNMQGLTELDNVRQALKVGRGDPGSAQ